MTTQYILAKEDQQNSSSPLKLNVALQCGNWVTDQIQCLMAYILLVDRVFKQEVALLLLLIVADV